MYCSRGYTGYTYLQTQNVYVCRADVSVVSHTLPCHDSINKLYSLLNERHENRRGLRTVCVGLGMQAGGMAVFT